MIATKRKAQEKMNEIPPSYIKRLNVIDAPIKHKWDTRIACHFDRKQSRKLLNAIDNSSYKAKIAIGALLAEVITWRFVNQAETNDAFQRIEAAWCCAIDSAYAKEIDFSFSKVEGGPLSVVHPVQSALEVGIKHLYIVHMRYKKQSKYLAEAVEKLALVAHHVVPEKKTFSSWFSEMLRRSEDSFPRGIDRSIYYELESYDCSHEKPCFKDFFKPDFAYTDENTKEAINRFLRSLNPDENPYLKTPEEMKAEGFAGTPYTF